MEEKQKWEENGFMKLGDRIRIDFLAKHMPVRNMKKYLKYKGETCTHIYQIVFLK